MNLTRDLSTANARGIARLMRELQNHDREVAIFLIDHSPMETPYVESDILIGCGWDDNPPEDRRASVRWLGEGYSPSGVGSCLVSDDPDCQLVLLSNRIARESLKLEKATGRNAWCFAQPAIVTLKDAQKLSRFMGHYLNVA